MRLMFLGDVVGRAGRDALARELPLLRARYHPDLVVVNGENATHGFGISEENFRQLRDAGADVISLGNHAFDQREALIFIERERELLRPLNFPAGVPGRGTTLFTTPSGKRVLVMNVMGRLMIEPMLDDPFAAVARELELCPLRRGADAIIIDMHAEATSEKMAMAHFVDGRVSLIVGTHTHVPTSDHRIFPGGTAYISDVGMCGDYNSVIGMEKTEPINRFVRKVPAARLEPATGPATVCGVAVEIDTATGLALKIAPIRVAGCLQPALPDFW
ncbi:MAG: TIGR00282 family metallophosphoesterase [Pseudomonadota bacterium]|nr:TIGR00282 family metallophosphoesterase [Pseudomonadota bacterium]